MLNLSSNLISFGILNKSLFPEFLIFTAYPQFFLLMTFQKLILAFLFLVAFLNLPAQTLDYQLTLYNTQNRPMANVEVTLVETIQRKVIKGNTNAAGVVKFTIEGGKIWQMNILKIQNYLKWQIVMPEYKGSKTERLTYHPEKILWEMTPPANRSKLNIQTEKQNLTQSPKATAQLSSVKITFVKNNNQPLAGFPIRLTCIRLLKTYEATTNARGEVFFALPNDEEFELDMEEKERYDYIKTLKKSSEMSLIRIFEPYIFPEQTENDTLYQEIPEQVKEGTSNRHLLTGYFVYEKGGLVANQAVFLKDMDGVQTFSARTNEQGVARLMLPKEKRYAVLMEKLSQEVLYFKEVVDLTRAWGISNSQKTIILPDLRQNRIKLPYNLYIQKIGQPQELNGFFKEAQLNFLAIQDLSFRKHEYASLLFKLEGVPPLPGLSRGFLFTTGSVLNAFGLNDSPSASWAGSHYPVTDRVPAVFRKDSTQLFDANVMEFTVQPAKSKLTFDFIFASEEYNEYLDYDDGFGIFIEGEGFDSQTNIALLSDRKTPVSVATVNLKSNAELFIDNSLPDSELFRTFQYDGFSKKASVSVPVKPQNTYKIKIVIFDRKDAIYDSGLFVNFYSN